MAQHYARNNVLKHSHLNIGFMKKSILTVLFSVICIVTFAQANSSVKYQSGYYKPSTGTYVQPHYKTSTNTTNHDNFSTKGNVNSYSGQSGSKAKDYSPGASNYGKGQTIQTGPKGGQYYNNTNGNKTYVPKR